ASLCTLRPCTAATTTILPSLALKAWHVRCARPWRLIRAPRTRCHPRKARLAGKFALPLVGRAASGRGAAKRVGVSTIFDERSLATMNPTPLASPPLGKRPSPQGGG